MHQPPDQSARIGGIFFTASRTFTASTWCSHSSGSLSPLLFGLSAARARFDSLIPSRIADLMIRYSTHAENMKPASDIAVNKITTRASSLPSSCIDSPSSVVLAPSQVLDQEYAEARLSPPTSVTAGDPAMAARPPVRSGGTHHPHNVGCWLDIRYFLRDLPRLSNRQRGHSEVLFLIQLTLLLVALWAFGGLME